MPDPGCNLSRLEVSSGKEDICPLILNKAPACSMGLLESVPVFKFNTWQDPVEATSASSTPSWAYPSPFLPPCPEVPPSHSPTTLHMSLLGTYFCWLAPGANLQCWCSSADLPGSTSSFPGGAHYGMFAKPTTSPGAAALAVGLRIGLLI